LWTVTYPYLAPPLQITLSEFRPDVWRHKTGLSYGVVCVILRPAGVLVELWWTVRHMKTSYTVGHFIFRLNQSLKP